MKGKARYFSLSKFGTHAKSHTQAALPSQHHPRKAKKQTAALSIPSVPIIRIKFLPHLVVAAHARRRARKYLMIARKHVKPLKAPAVALRGDARHERQQREQAEPRRNHNILHFKHQRGRARQLERLHLGRGGGQLGERARPDAGRAGRAVRAGRAREARRQTGGRAVLPGRARRARQQRASAAQRRVETGRAEAAVDRAGGGRKLPGQALRKREQRRSVAKHTQREIGRFRSQCANTRA